MKQMLSKCILSHFATDFSAQKPYFCTENSKTTAPARVRRWYIPIYRGVPAC